MHIKAQESAFQRNGKTDRQTNRQSEIKEEHLLLLLKWNLNLFMALGI